MIFPESAGLLLEDEEHGNGENGGDAEERERKLERDRDRDRDGDGVGHGTGRDDAFIRSFDEEMRMMNRLAPICDNVRYAAKPRYKFTDEDAACVDIVVTVGGDDVEARALAAAPSAAAVVDLWEFAQFAEIGEIDGTGAARMLKRSIAAEVVAPVLEEVMATTGRTAPGMKRNYDISAAASTASTESSDMCDSVGRDGDWDGDEFFEEEEERRQRELQLTRARLVIGVVGLVNFVMQTAPLEEVERFHRKDSTWATGGGGGVGLEGLDDFDAEDEKTEETEDDGDDDGYINR